MLHSKSRFGTILRAIAIILVHAILLSDVAYAIPDLNRATLAPWPGTQSPVIRREAERMKFEWEGRFVVAKSAEHKRSLETHQAEAVLNKDGKILVSKELAKDDLKLLRAVIRKEIESIMQIMARNEEARYAAVCNLIRGERGLLEAYYKLLPGKIGTHPKMDLVVNDCVARAFELLLLLDKETRLLTRNEMSEDERKFLDIAKRAIVESEEGKLCFTGQFSDSYLRRGEIEIALINDQEFYQVASADSEKPQASEQPDTAGAKRLVKIKAIEECGQIIDSGLIADIIPGLEEMARDDGDIAVRVTAKQILNILRIRLAKAQSAAEKASPLAEMGEGFEAFNAEVNGLVAAIEGMEGVPQASFTITKGIVKGEKPYEVRKESRRVEIVFDLRKIQDTEELRNLYWDVVTPYFMEFTAKGYDFILAEGIDIWSPEYYEYLGTYKKLFIAPLEIKDKDTVLDIGTGPGSMAFLAAPYAKSVTGIDVSAKAIEASNKSAKAAGIDNTVFKIQDASRTDFESESFDKIIAHFVFAFLPQEIRRRILKEAHRLLKPGGTLGLFVYSADDNPFAWGDNEWRAELHEVGFEVAPYCISIPESQTEFRRIIVTKPGEDENPTPGVGMVSPNTLRIPEIDFTTDRTLKEVTGLPSAESGKLRARLRQKLPGADEDKPLVGGSFVWREEQHPLWVVSYGPQNARKIAVFDLIAEALLAHDIALTDTSSMRWRVSGNKLVAEYAGINIVEIYLPAKEARVSAPDKKDKAKDEPTKRGGGLMMVFLTFYPELPLWAKALWARVRAGWQGLRKWLPESLKRKKSSVVSPEVPKGMDWSKIENIGKEVDRLAARCRKPVAKLSQQDYRTWGLASLLERYDDDPLKIYDMIRKFIKKRIVDDKLPSNKTGIIFSPHPDDDVASCGGIMQKLKAKNNRVIVVYMTSGTGGVPEALARSKKAKAEIRKKEALAALALTGCEYEFLNLPFYESGRTGSINEEYGAADVKKIRDVLEKYNPDFIFRPGEFSDPHRTHNVCNEILGDAVWEADIKKKTQAWSYRSAWETYSIYDENIQIVTLSQKELGKKKEMIKRHVSQAGGGLPVPGDDPRPLIKRVWERSIDQAKQLKRLGLLPKRRLVECFEVEGVVIPNLRVRFPLFIDHETGRTYSANEPREEGDTPYTQLLHEIYRGPLIREASESDEPTSVLPGTGAAIDRKKTSGVSEGEDRPATSLLGSLGIGESHAAHGGRRRGGEAGHGGFKRRADVTGMQQLPGGELTFRGAASGVPEDPLRGASWMFRYARDPETGEPSGKRPGKPAQSASEGEGGTDMAALPTFPIDIPDLLDFARFHFRKGATYGSRWHWMSETPDLYDNFSFTIGRRHTGIDIFEYETPSGEIRAIPIGTSIRSILPGKVVYARAGIVNEIIIETLDRKLVSYAHITPGVTEGDTVKSGDIIGIFGEVLSIRIPHVHLEVIEGDYSLPTKDEYRDDWDSLSMIPIYVESLTKTQSVDPLTLWPEIAKSATIEKDDTRISPPAGMAPSGAGDSSERDSEPGPSSDEEASPKLTDDGPTHTSPASDRADEASDGNSGDSLLNSGSSPADNGGRVSSPGRESLDNGGLMMMFLTFYPEPPLWAKALWARVRAWVKSKRQTENVDSQPAAGEGDMTKGPVPSASEGGYRERVVTLVSSAATRLSSFWKSSRSALVLTSLSMLLVSVSILATTFLTATFNNAVSSLFLPTCSLIVVTVLFTLLRSSPKARKSLLNSSISEPTSVIEYLSLFCFFMKEAIIHPNNAHVKEKKGRILRPPSPKDTPGDELGFRGAPGVTEDPLRGAPWMVRYARDPETGERSGQAARGKEIEPSPQGTALIGSEAEQQYIRQMVQKHRADLMGRGHSARRATFIIEYLTKSAIRALGPEAELHKISEAIKDRVSWGPLPLRRYFINILKLPFILVLIILPLPLVLLVSKFFVAKFLPPPFDGIMEVFIFFTAFCGMMWMLVLMVVKAQFKTEVGITLFNDHEYIVSSKIDFSFFPGKIKYQRAFNQLRRLEEGEKPCNIVSRAIKRLIDNSAGSMEELVSLLDKKAKSDTKIFYYMSGMVRRVWLDLAAEASGNFLGYALLLLCKNNYKDAYEVLRFISAEGLHLNRAGRARRGGPDKGIGGISTRFATGHGSNRDTSRGDELEKRPAQKSDVSPLKAVLEQTDLIKSLAKVFDLTPLEMAHIFIGYKPSGEKYSDRLMDYVITEHDIKVEGSTIFINLNKVLDIITERFAGYIHYQKSLYGSWNFGDTLLSDNDSFVIVFNFAGINKRIIIYRNPNSSVWVVNKPDVKHSFFGLFYDVEELQKSIKLKLGTGIEHWVASSEVQEIGTDTDILDKPSAARKKAPKEPGNQPPFGRHNYMPEAEDTPPDQLPNITGPQKRPGEPEKQEPSPNADEEREQHLRDYLSTIEQKIIKKSETIQREVGEFYDLYDALSIKDKHAKAAMELREELQKVFDDNNPSGEGTYVLSDIELIANVLDHIGVAPDDSLLDAGSGKAMLLFFLCHMFRIRATGIEAWLPFHKYGASLENMLIEKGYIEEGQISLINENFTHQGVDFSNDSLIFYYARGTKSKKELLQKMLTIKEGSRIVIYWALEPEVEYYLATHPDFKVEIVSSEDCVLEEGAARVYTRVSKQTDKDSQPDPAQSASGQQGGDEAERTSGAKERGRRRELVEFIEKWIQEESEREDEWEGSRFKDIPDEVVGIFADMGMEYHETFGDEIAAKRMKSAKTYLTDGALELLRRTRNPEILRLTKASASMLLRRKLNPVSIVGYIHMAAAKKAQNNVEIFKPWVAIIDRCIPLMPEKIDENELDEFIKGAKTPQELLEKLIKEYPDLKDRLSLTASRGPRADKPDESDFVISEEVNIEAVVREYDRTGESIIINADHMLRKDVVVDLEGEVRDMLVKYNVIKGGKIVIHAREEANAKKLEIIINRVARDANESIETITIMEADITGGRPMSEAKQTEKLIEKAYAKGVTPGAILAIARGPLKKATKDLRKTLSRNKVALIILNGGGGRYKLIEGLKKAMERRTKALKGEAPGDREKDWIITLHPIEPMSEELEREHERYLASLAVEQGA